MNLLTCRFSFNIKQARKGEEKKVGRGECEVYYGKRLSVDIIQSHSSYSRRVAMTASLKAPNLVFTLFFISFMLTEHKGSIFSQ